MLKLLLCLMLGASLAKQFADPLEGLGLFFAPYNETEAAFEQYNGAYSHKNAVAYARKHWNHPNHKCGNYQSCSPYSYWGQDVCGYPSHGGDCANFVSQCLLAGGHPHLSGGAPCRGYPCGKEEIGATNLAKCLKLKGWTRKCGKNQAPPSNIKPGDVLVYHVGSCDDPTAHATLVVGVKRSGKRVKDVTIACHSSPQWNRTYKYMSGSHPYLDWLHHA